MLDLIYIKKSNFKVLTCKTYFASHFNADGEGNGYKKTLGILYKLFIMSEVA